jgi:hypothetical protein
MVLKYGGRREAVAPHEKHGSHVRRRGAGCAFWVVLGGGSWASPLTLILPDGTEAIALFSGEEEAQMFCDFLGAEEETSPTIRRTTAGTILSMLYCPWLARQVALDPLPGLRGRRFLELLTIDRTRFARRFVSVNPEPVVRLARGGSGARPLARGPSEN